MPGEKLVYGSTEVDRIIDRHAGNEERLIVQELCIFRNRNFAVFIGEEFAKLIKNRMLGIEFEDALRLYLLFKGHRVY